MDDVSICPICGGTGNFIVSMEQFIPCWNCNGLGFVHTEEKEEEEMKNGY